MSMAAAINTRIGSTPRENVRELILDGFRFKHVEEDAAKLLQEIPQLQLLTANRTLLSDVSGFPLLDKLITLEIQDSALTDNSNLQHLVNMMPSLTELYLSGNRFQKLESMACLKGLKDLRKLEIELNPCANDDYVKTLFTMIPQLQIVDERDRDGNVVESDANDDDESDEEEDNAESASKDLLKKFYNEEMAEDDDEEEDFDPTALGDGEEDDAEDDEDFEHTEGTEEEPPGSSPPEDEAMQSPEGERKKARLL